MFSVNPRAKKALKWFSLCLLILLISLCLSLWLMLTTERGRVWLVHSVVGVINHRTILDIEVGGLLIPSLGEWQFDSLVVYKQYQQNRETIVFAEDLRLHWQPDDLWHRQLVIDHLQVDSLDIFSQALLNIPVELQQQKPSKDLQISSPIQAQKRLLFPSIDAIRLPIELKKLKVNRLYLEGLTLKGQSIPVIELDGGLNLTEVTMQLQARSLVDKPTVIDFATSLIRANQQRANQLMVEGEVIEEADGMLGRLLLLPAQQGLDTNFRFTISQENEKYAISVDRLSLPISQHQVAIQGQLVTNQSFSQGTLSDISIDIDRSNHSFEGSWNRQALNLQLQLNQFPLKILSPWQSHVQSGHVSTEISINGSIDSPSIEGRASIDTHYKSLPLSIIVEGFASKRQANIVQLDGQWGNTVLNGAGHLDWSHSHSDFMATIEDLDILYLQDLGIALPKNMDVRLVSAEAQIKGRVQDLQGELVAQVEGQYVDEDFYLRAALRKPKHIVLIDEAHLSMAGGESVARGQFDTESLFADIKVDVNTLPLSLLQLVGIDFPSSIEGKADGEIILQGKLNVDDLSTLKTSLKANIGGRFEQQAFTITAKIHKPDQILQVDELKLSLAEGEASVTGVIDANTLRGKLAISADDFPLSLIELTRVKLPEGLSAFARADLTLEGSLREPLLEGAFGFTGRYQEIPFSLHGDGRYQQSAVTINYFNILTFDQMVLSLAGEINPQELNLQINAESLPTKLLSVLGMPIQEGEFSANFRAHGPLRLPDIDGDLRYQSTLVGYDGERGVKDINFNWQLKVKTETGVYSFYSLFERDDQPPGQVSLTIPQAFYRNFLQQEKSSQWQKLPLNFIVKGQLDLQTLSFLFDPELHRLNGKVMGNIQLKGNFAEPDIQGEISINDGRYQNPTTGTIVENIRCKLSASQYQLSFETCLANDDNSGSYLLAGKFRLPIGADRGAIDLKLQANSANILRRPDIEGEATGELEVKGDLNELLVQGDFQVSPLTVVLDATRSSNIPSIKVTKVDKIQTVDSAQSTENNLMSKTKLNVTISADQQAFLRGRGLEAELKGQVILRGSAIKPRYDGEFQTVRGVFEIFGKKFVLEHGKVIFANDAIGLDIEGVYQKSGQLVRARLSGSGEEPQLELSAEPMMAEDEILAFIIFGKSIQTMTPIEAIQLANAIQTLRGGGTFFDPIGKTRDLLGVDTLTVDTESNGEGKNEVNVGIGKYLNEKVYLELERSNNPSQPWKGNLQIELRPNLNLESSTGGSSGIEGAELRWKKDY